MNPPRHPCSRCGSTVPNPSCYVCWEGDETPEPLEAAPADPVPVRPFDVGCQILAALGAISRAIPILLRRCQWSQDEDGNWDTACGGRFTFETGGPVENKARWCLYCGGELTAVPYPAPPTPDPDIP